MLVVAVVSRKGGVGKTSTAVSLAAAFAEAGAPSLVVDLDAQASASFSLGLSRAELAPSMYDVLFRKVPIAQAVRPTAFPGLSVLPASVDLLHADLELAPVRNRDDLLRQALKRLQHPFSTLFFDCPPALGFLVQSALVAADALLVPCSPHPLALEGLDVTLELARRTRLRCGSAPLPAFLLLTQVERKTRLGRTGVETLELVAETCGASVLRASIPWAIRVAESPRIGLPVLATDPRGFASQAYREAARELATSLRREDLALALENRSRALEAALLATAVASEVPGVLETPERSSKA